MSNWNTILLTAEDVNTYKKVFRYLSSNAKRKWKITLVTPLLGFTQATTDPKSVLKKYKMLMYKKDWYLAVKTKSVIDAVSVKIFFGNNVYSPKPLKSFNLGSMMYKINLNSTYGTLIGNYIDETFDKMIYSTQVPRAWSPSQRKAKVKRLRKQGYMVRAHTKETPLSKTTQRKINRARAKRNIS